MRDKVRPLQPRAAALFILLSFPFPEPAIASALGSPFTTLLARAREHSLSLKQGEAEVEAARLKKELAESASLPRISSNATWAQAFPRAGAGTLRNQVYSAQVTSDLYDFGREDAREASADARLKAAETEASEDDEALVFTLARALARLRFAAESLALEREQRDLVREKAELLEKNYHSGLRPEEDVLLARLGLGRSELAVARLEADLKRAQAALDEIAGRGAAEAVAAWIQAAVPEPMPRAGEAPPAGPFPGPAQVARFAKILDSWDKFLPSPAQRRRELERAALAAEARALDADRLPNLAGSAAAQFAGPWLGPLRPGLTFQLQLTWEIPWNGKYTNGVRANEVGLRQSTLADEAEKRARVEAEADARAAFDQARALWERGRSQISLSVRHRAMLLRRYNAGRATAFELSAADADLLSLRQDFVTQRQAMLNALISAAQARGQSDLAEVFE